MASQLDRLSKLLDGLQNSKWSRLEDDLLGENCPLTSARIPGDPRHVEVLEQVLKAVDENREQVEYLYGERNADRQARGLRHCKALLSVNLAAAVADEEGTASERLPQSIRQAIEHYTAVFGSDGTRFPAAFDANARQEQLPPAIAALFAQVASQVPDQVRGYQVAHRLYRVLIRPHHPIAMDKIRGVNIVLCDGLTGNCDFPRLQAVCREDVLAGWFPDPVTMAMQVMDDDMIASIDAAWRRSGISGRSIMLRWPFPTVRCLMGASAGVAIGALFRAVQSGERLSETKVVSAQLPEIEGGALVNVQKAVEKCRAAAGQGLQLGISGLHTELIDTDANPVYLEDEESAYRFLCQPQRDGAATEFMPDLCPENQLHENIYRVVYNGKQYAAWRTASGRAEESITRYEQLKKLPDGHCRCRELFARDGFLYVLYDLVDGEHFLSKADRDGREFEESLRWLQSFAAAIDAAHRADFYHGELSDKDFLLTTDGQTVLLGFGRLQAKLDADSRIRQRIGSFQPPEQMPGLRQRPGAKSDHWAFAVMAFTCLTGRAPFLSTDDVNHPAEVRWDLLRGEGFPENVNLELVFRKAFALKASERFQTAEEFVAALSRPTPPEGMSGFSPDLAHAIRDGGRLLVVATDDEPTTLRRLERIAQRDGRTFFTINGLLGELRRGADGGVETAREDSLSLFSRYGERCLLAVTDSEKFLEPMILAADGNLKADVVEAQLKRLMRTKGVAEPAKSNGESPQLPADLAIVLVASNVNISDTLPASNVFFAMPALPMELESLLREHTEPGQDWARRLLPEFVWEARGLTQSVARQAVRLSIVKHGGLTAEVIDELQAAKRQMIGQQEVLEMIDTKSDSMKNVAGARNLKHGMKLRGPKSPIGPSHLLRVGQGLLLGGLPGCGKSLFVRSLADDWGLPLLRLDFSRIPASVIDGTESKLRESLDLAGRVSPAMLWIRGPDKAFSPDLSTRLLMDFLDWLQEHDSDVFAVVTAQDGSRLPPALTQRFDLRFFLDLPENDARRQMLERRMRSFNFPIEEPVVDQLTEGTEGYSGAEIDSLVHGMLQVCDEPASESLPKVAKKALDASPDPLSKRHEDRFRKLRQEWLSIALPAD